MPITEIAVITAHLAFHAPFRISLSESDGTTNLFVRVRDQDGRTGWGEASPSPSITGDTSETMRAVAPAMAQALLGASTSAPEEAAARLRGVSVGQVTLRGGFETALWDLAAQEAGVPLYELLGGGRRAFETDNTVGMDTPEHMAATARRFLSEGFGAIKAKVGSGVDEDVARIQAIRSAIGPDVPLRVDANQGWTAEEALAVLEGTRDSALQYCEQPVARGDDRAMKQVRDAAIVPVMADESVFDHLDARRLAQHQVCDYLNIKLSKSAGLATGLKIADVAKEHGMACMVGCMSETRLGLTTAAHLVSAKPVISFADLDSHVDHTLDPVVGGISIVDGVVHLPEGPGLGASLKQDFVDTCHVEVFG